MNDYRILVVDDEEDLCEILKFNLENEGYEVDTANSAEEAMKMDISSYHLILLDVMMGEISGFKMANILKKDKKTAKVPIIFITAKDTENDTVTGFNLGADDYISKPFSNKILLARIKAHLENSRLQNEIQTYIGIKLDVNKKCVKVDKENVELTNFEFKILENFISNQGTVFSRSKLLSLLRGDGGFEVSERAVDVQIVNLRRKIKDYGHYIETVRGVGYKLKELDV